MNNEYTIKRYNFELETVLTVYNTLINSEWYRPGMPGGGRIPIIGGNMPGGKPGIDGIGMPGMNGGIGMELGMDCDGCDC